MVDKKLSSFPDIQPSDIKKLICLFLDQNNAIKNGNVDFATLDALLAHKAGTETFTGNKTFSGDTTFSGNATFNNTVNANISGNAGTVTNGVYTTSNNTISGNNTFTGDVNLGSKATATTQDINDNDTSVATTAFTYNLENSQKTNCFLKIPQDINLELNNGTLTLKAGSKVYIPNGSGTFNALTIASDISSSSSWATSDVMIARSENGSALYAYKLDNHYSGSSAPSSPIEGTIWYDTTNNLIKRYNGSSWSNGGVSFPICIASMVSGTGLVSIKQVFNGVGFIGNVLFALPGSTALIPNGRYSNGMPRNSVVNLSSVMTGAVATTTGVDSYKIFLYGSGIGIYGTFIYDQTTNKNYVSENISSENARGRMLVGSVYMNSSNGKIIGIDTTDTFNGASRYDVKNMQSEYLSSIAQGNYKEKSLIFNGPIGGGNITLSRPYTDFDALLIEHMGDNQNTWCATTLLTRYELDNRRANTPSNGSWALFNGQVYWTCTGASTTTSFVSSGENGSIRAIYGIKF